LTTPEDFTDLRHAPAPLVAAVLALNAVHSEMTSELDEAKLRRMLAEAHLALATPAGDAFIIVFDEGAAYDSPNFLWFRDRCPGFLYVDRIVVAASARGRGLARKLYDAVAGAAAASGRGRVVCEVNFEPPNPGSDAFHAALGFIEAGRGAPYAGKVVRYLEKAVGEKPVAGAS